MLLFLLLPSKSLASVNDAKVVFDSSTGKLTFQYRGAIPSNNAIEEFSLNEGNNDPGWLKYAESIREVEFEENFAYVCPTSCYRWFKGITSIKTINGLQFLKTSEVTTMAEMFDGCSNLTNIHVDDFETSKVTDMSNMFRNCISITDPLNVSGFDTHIVTNMSGMFEGCQDLTTIDVSQFKTDKVTDMGNMFKNCYMLTNLNVKDFNTSNVTNMQSMFEYCRELPSVDVTKFNTAKVTDMSNMFKNCEALNTLDVSKFNTSNVTNMQSMFNSCSTIKNLDVSGFNTANVTNMGSMFYDCNEISYLDLSKFNTEKVTDMSYMFYNCLKLTALDLINFNTSSVEEMTGIFTYCEKLKTIYADDGFTLKQIKGVNMFEECIALEGAVKFNENELTDKMANYKTGYFTKYKKYGNQMVIVTDKARYTRNHSYEWATMCLPFAFSTTDNSTYQFYAMGGIKDNALNVTPLEGTIEAGTPVFVRGASSTENNNLIYIIGVDNVLVDNAQTQNATSGNFVGTFEGKTNLSDNNYIILHDKFWLASELKAKKPGSTVNINALRAYITPQVGIKRIALLSIVPGGDGSGTTGIDSIIGTNGNNEGKAEIFDIQGRRLNGLQHGLNIVRIGGVTKKVIMK